MATALRAYLFTDLLGYGEFLRTEGDVAAARLLRSSRRLIVGELANARGATVQEVVADTVYATFRSPVEAVRTAVAIVRRVDAYNARRQAAPVQMSIAIHAGESVRQGGGYVGSAVALASQLAHAGRPGQVLVTDTVYGLVRSADVPPMRDLGIWGPHGIGQTVHVYDVDIPGSPETPAAAGHPRLLTILFTDIAKSTDRTAEVGDRGWGELVRQHHGLVRRELRRFGGVEVDTAGDGFFATFDAPSDAIRCAVAVREVIRTLGFEIRQGIHVGECELIAGKVGGISVVVAARAREASKPGEILVTGTLRDVVAGSPVRSSERGTRVLKGVPGRWRLHAVEAIT